jgi:GNAT superfamily N-acetyltransferase
LVEEVPSVVGPPAADAPPAGAVSIVRATTADEPALRIALYEAVCWRETSSPGPVEDVLADPAVRLYLEDWGRPGDVGFVAADAFGRRGGAAWYRLFTTHRHGYGFVSPDVPEVSMGLQRSWRGLGLGRRLLESLHAVALDAGVPRLSLSVEVANRRAVRLYKRFGYVPGGSIGTSRTMEVQLLPEAMATITPRGP